MKSAMASLKEARVIAPSAAHELQSPLVDPRSAGHWQAAAPLTPRLPQPRGKPGCTGDSGRGRGQTRRRRSTPSQPRLGRGPRLAAPGHAGCPQRCWLARVSDRPPPDAPSAAVTPEAAYGPLPILRAPRPRQ
ncbi:hypothetical protein NDU88_007739 [Pleurodeles waltl]|uniref:Uncharacterized protein n=1 Tax=Pleurodeles waltl TaxID=8319 RepID=A0AAV7NY89_PLEWA|nr:hypothetical protein NDU88_007739 [Pleurodeles waltl]